MADPSLEEILLAFEQPYQVPLTPPFAAAYLLVRGCDGPALRELAGLTDGEWRLAFELIPVAAEEAVDVLEPVRQQLWPDGEGAVPPAVVLTYSSPRLTSEQVDELAGFVDRLTAAVESAGLGEVDGPVDEDDELTVFCYGDDIERLMRLIREQVKNSPVKPARLGVR